MFHVENNDDSTPRGGVDGLPRDCEPDLDLCRSDPVYSPMSTTYDEAGQPHPPIPDPAATDRREAKPRQPSPRTDSKNRKARYSYTVEEATRLAETAEEELRVELALARNAAARRQAELIRLKERYKEAEFLLDVQIIKERVKEASRASNPDHSPHEKRGGVIESREDGDYDDHALPHRPGVGPAPDPDDDAVSGLDLPPPRKMYSVAMTQNIQMETPRENTQTWMPNPSEPPEPPERREFNKEIPYGNPRRIRGGRARRSRPRSTPYGGWGPGSRQTEPGPSGYPRYQY
jgi:hypothetical protein